MAEALVLNAGKCVYVDYVPSSDVAAGDVVVENERVMVAQRPISADRLGAMAIEGLMDFPKDTGSSSAIDDGKKVYWDENNEVANETSSGNLYLGLSVYAPSRGGDDDEFVRVMKRENPALP